MMKKYALIFVILLVISASRITPVLAMEDGAYVVSNITYYTNPDTGVVDDGGDTSIGEGMSRNVTYEQSLYELSGGKHMATVRIKMISYISKVEFYVQEAKDDSENYKSVSYTVVGENKEKDTKDFRFELPEADRLIKPVIYVEPMGRDVTYFIALDIPTAKADNGGFAAYNKSGDTNESAESAESAAEQNNNSLPETVKTLPKDIQSKVQEAAGATVKQSEPGDGAASFAQDDDVGKTSSSAKTNEKTKLTPQADIQKKPESPPREQTSEAKAAPTSPGEASAQDDDSASAIGAVDKIGNSDTADTEVGLPQEDEVAGNVQYSAEGIEIPANDSKDEGKSAKPLFLYAASGLVVVAGLAIWRLARLRKKTAK